MSETTLAERRDTRLAEAFRLEELAGLRLAARARLVALVVVAVWLFFWTSPPETVYLEMILVVFALIGIAHYRVRRGRWDRPWLSYLFVALDFALLAFATLGLPLVLDSPQPPQMELRNGTIVYFFIFVAFVAVNYAPGLMLWAGFCGAAAWGAGVLWILGLPETVTHAGHRDLPPAERVAQHLDPHFVDFAVRQQEIVVLLLLSGVLAAVVWRGKRLVERQAAAERERANLARYFSPNMVDKLARHDRLPEAHRSQPVAVLFADMIGFTQVCEYLEPEKVISLLREFHGRMAKAVFDQEGTVDKYIGDSIMATFGTPLTGPRDASHAVACARAMIAAMDAWNRARWAEGYQPIRVGIGIHYGPAVQGDIGGERRFEFAVVGDTVNVASRLEEATRDLGVDIAVSDDLVQQVRAEGGGAVLEGFVQALPQQLRNREETIEVWTWRGAS